MAEAIVKDLLVAKIEDRYIHVIAKHGTEMRDLPEATLLERTDLKTSVGHGVGVGGAVGGLAGLVAVSFPPAGMVLGGGMLAASALAGAGFGAWASSMIGISTPNRELEEFEAAINRGEVLMLVDVPKEQVDDIEALVRKHHPEAHFGGVEPNKPVFP